jgi:hypothetical protein
LDGYKRCVNRYSVRMDDGSEAAVEPGRRVIPMMYIAILSALFVGGILYILKAGAAIIQADDELMDKH